MIVAVFIGFWATVLADQDGFGRMFARGILLLERWLPGASSRTEKEGLRRLVVIVLTAVLPAVLFLAVGEPVTLLQLAGAIEAAQIPIVGLFALILIGASSLLSAVVLGFLMAWVIVVAESLITRYGPTGLALHAEKRYADGKGVETPGRLDDEIEIGVFARGKSGKEADEKRLFFEKRRLTEAEQKLTLVVDEEPYEVGIDPYNKLIDRVSTDNRKHVALK